MPEGSATSLPPPSPPPPPLSLTAAVASLTRCTAFRRLLLFVWPFTIFGLFGRLRSLHGNAGLIRHALTTTHRLLLALAPAAAPPAAFLFRFFRGLGLFLAIFGFGGLSLYLFLFLLQPGKSQVPGLENDGRRLLRRTHGPLALLPIEALLGTVEPRLSDDLDLDVELFLQGGELAAIVVLQRVRQLRVEADADALDRARGGAGLDAAEDGEAHHLLARQAADAVAGGAGAVGAELEGLLDALAVDLEQAVGRDPAHRRAGL